MNHRDDVTKLTPAQEDPALHRYFALLPEHGPAPLFEDRVLACVWRPEPEWVRNARFAGQELVATGRIWLLIGAVTFGSLIPLAILLTSGAAFATEIGAAVDWLFQRGIPSVWAAASSDLSNALSQLGTWTSGLPVSGETLQVMAMVSLPVLVVCAWGLSRTMRAKVRR